MYNFLLLNIVILLIHSAPTMEIAENSNVRIHDYNTINVSESVQQDTLARYEFSAPQMGTLFRIVMYAENDSLAEIASRVAFERIEELNSVMSDYLPDSEINQLSTSSGTIKPTVTDPSLFHVLEFATDISEKTEGAFDVTVGPFVRLWRDVRSDPNPRVPSITTLSDLSRRTGFRHIKLNRDNQTVYLDVPGMQLDLGGIAKGYATDEALAILRKHGIKSSFVDGGGDIRFGDAPPDRPGWGVAIPSTNTDGTTTYLELILSNCAIATSGDLFQYVEIGGTRYSHIIDPRTGLGITDRRTVTVIAQDGITADSYASALSVLGPVEGIPLADDLPELDVRFEQLEGDSIEEVESTGFGNFRAYE